jgi:hypothetical protein
MRWSELFGLVFFALLKSGYYDGAKQLIETGCVSYMHVTHSSCVSYVTLSGCVIQNSEVNNV